MPRTIRCRFQSFYTILKTRIRARALTSMSADSDPDLDSHGESDSQNTFETPGKVLTMNLDNTDWKRC